MKFNLNYLFAIFLSLGLVLTSCQDEVLEITDPQQNETVVPGSQLSMLMSNATANFGAYDNVLDNSSCFSIELPVTIVVGNITIVIENEEGLEELEDFFEEFEDEDDFFDFVFPLTIIFNDYSEVVINNEDELEDFISQCDDNEADEVIECIDFVYPVTFSVFNSQFDVIDTVTIENDEALYDFLESLEEDENTLIVSLNYPVSLVYPDGETVQVNSNEELIEVIEAAEDICDDYDEEDCDEELISANLVECVWEIDDIYNDFDDYYFDFLEDGTLKIMTNSNDELVEGTWDISNTDNGLILVIEDLTAFQEDLGGEWLIVDCDDDELTIVRGDMEFELEQECEDDEVDCSVNDISNHIVECAWLMESNLIDTTLAVYVYFTPDGQILLTNPAGTETQVGTWDLNVTGSSIFMNLEFQSEFEVLSGTWAIAECDEGELYLINEDNFIYLDQDCDVNEEAFECFLSFDPDIEICDAGTDGPYDVDLTTVFANCPADSITFFESYEDAENYVNPIANPSAFSVVNLETTVYAKIQIENQYIILEVEIYIEDCGNENPFECYNNEGYELEECDDDNDGLALFNLYEAVPSCDSTVPTVISFHASLQGAESNVDIIENATAYQNINNPDTVYVRVGLLNNPEEFIIYPVELIVSDCGNAECSEGEISDYLQTCEWIPVSYNGDDNLIDYVMLFGPEAVTIEGNGQAITTTYSVQGDSPVFVFFSGINLPEIQALSGDWTVVSCEPDRIELQRDNDTLVLEQECN